MGGHHVQADDEDIQNDGGKARVIYMLYSSALIKLVRHLMARNRL